MVNMSVGNLLRILSGENTNKWDMALAHEKFTYNDPINKSTSTSPFHIFYGRSPKRVVDRVQFPYLE